MSLSVVFAVAGLRSFCGGVGDGERDDHLLIALGDDQTATRVAFLTNGAYGGIVASRP
jgi:hypothetical protein